MRTIVTVPAGHEEDVGLFSFGPLPNSMSDLVIPHTSNVGGFYFGGSTTINSLSFPNLVTIDPVDAGPGGLSTQACTSLTSLSVPNLMTVAGDVVLVTCAYATLSMPLFQACGGIFAIGDTTTFTTVNVPNMTDCDELQFQSGLGANLSFPALQSIHALTSLASGQALISTGGFNGLTLDFPALVNISGKILISNAPHLTSINLPVWHPVNGIPFFKWNNDPNLGAATINQILARCVSNGGFNNGDINTVGTHAPTGQGLTDKATLIGRGVSVTTD